MLQRDLPGAYVGSYTGRGYNEYEEVSTGHAYQAAQAAAASNSMILSGRPAQITGYGLPSFAFGNLGLGLIGLTAALLLLKRAL